ncbi:hypothetical protein DY000_02029895 [Brassica cretica]|uniref:Uncharacterized protein n=1 Tax=Brassica cretica TaxID=69181 RepID=A0ABQ7DQK3_BRACR|nr:hypothetical protein DY000_02029895 [Brassica cretica]
MTSMSTDDKTSTSIDRSTQKSTDVSSCVLVPDVDMEITMGDLLELQDEAQPENLDHNLEKKLDDYQHASEKDLETSQEASIDRYPPDCIDRHPPESIELHPPESIDRHPLLDELHGFIVEMEPIEETKHESEASRNDNYKHLRPLTCAEEAAGLHKRVKRIHDPVKIVVPCAVVDVESPIPPDRSMQFSSYIDVLDDHQHVEASQRGLRFQDEVDKGPAELVSIDTDRTPSMDNTPSSSIDITTSPSIDTGRVSEQTEFDVSGNIRDGDTTTRSDKSGGKKRMNWKKRKRIMGDSQLSLIPRFSDGVRKFRDHNLHSILSPIRSYLWSIHQASINHFAIPDFQPATYMIPIRLLDDIMAKGDEQHVSGELSRVEEAGTEDATSTSIESTTSMSIDNITSTSTDDKTSTSIDRSTQKSTDVSCCVLVPDVDIWITMEDFSELEDETQSENLDHNLEKKLDDHQHTSEKDLETSLEASIDRHPPYIIDQHTPYIIDHHPPDSIDLHPPESIDRHPVLNEPHGFIVEMEPIEERVYESKTSRNDDYKHLRPLRCAEEAVGLHKRVKRIHDPVKIVVPCAVVEVEFPIPPDKGTHLSSYVEVLDNHQHVEVSQKGLRFRDEVDKGPTEPVSIDTDQIPSIDINKPTSIDTTTSPLIDTTISPSIDTTTSSSIDSGCVSEQKEFDVCGNLRDGDTTTRSEMYGGKKRKRIKDGPHVSLTPHYSDCVKKSRVRSRCFSHPFAKLRALLLAEMIDKGDELIEECWDAEAAVRPTISDIIVREDQIFVH